MIFKNVLIKLKEIDMKLILIKFNKKKKAMIPIANIPFIEY